MRILATLLCLTLFSGCTAMLLGDNNSNAGSYPSAKDGCNEKDSKDCAAKYDDDEP